MASYASKKALEPANSVCVSTSYPFTLYTASLDLEYRLRFEREHKRMFERVGSSCEPLTTGNEKPAVWHGGDKEIALYTVELGLRKTEGGRVQNILSCIVASCRGEPRSAVDLLGLKARYIHPPLAASLLRVPCPVRPEALLAFLDILACDTSGWC